MAVQKRGSTRFPITAHVLPLWIPRLLVVLATTTAVSAAVLGKWKEWKEWLPWINQYSWWLGCWRTVNINKEQTNHPHPIRDRILIPKNNSDQFRFPSHKQQTKTLLFLLPPLNVQAPCPRKVPARRWCRGFYRKVQFTEPLPANPCPCRAT